MSPLLYLCVACRLAYTRLSTQLNTAQHRQIECRLSTRPLDMCRLSTKPLDTQSAALELHLNGFKMCLFLLTSRTKRCVSLCGGRNGTAPALPEQPASRQRPWNTIWTTPWACLRQTCLRLRSPRCPTPSLSHHCSRGRRTSWQTPSHCPCPGWLSATRR